MPNIKKLVKINGVNLKEHMTYKVMIPEYLSVVIGRENDLIAANKNNEPTFDLAEGNFISMYQIKH